MNRIIMIGIAALLFAVPALAQMNQSESGQNQAMRQGDRMNMMNEVLNISNQQGYEGKAIVDANNEEIGEVSHLWVNKDRQPQFLAVEIGGWIGIGEQELLIPFSQVQSTTQGDLKLNIAREKLEQQGNPAGNSPDRQSTDQLDTQSSY